MSKRIFRNFLFFVFPFLLSMGPSEVWAIEPREEAKLVAAELSQHLSFKLGEKIFEGKVFSQAMSAWKIPLNHEFSSLMRELSKQKILTQYHSIGNLIMLTGEYEQSSVLLYLERFNGDVYQGFLSVANNELQDFSTESSVKLHRYLLDRQTAIKKQWPPWMPDSATLLMDVKLNAEQTQYIYLDSRSLSELKEVVSVNLKNANWESWLSAESGLSTWTNGHQQLQLYFSSQAEGTALYVLIQQNVKELHENSH